MKIGQEIFYISFMPGSYAGNLIASGRVISFDDEALVIDGIYPDHNGEYSEDFEDYNGERHKTLFLNRKEVQIFNDKKAAERALRKEESKNNA